MNSELFVYQEFLDAALAGLKSKKPVVIYGAFGSGRTQFVDQLLSKHEEKEPASESIRVNFDDFFPETFATLDALYKQIVMVVAGSTGQDIEAVMRNWEEYVVYSGPQISTTDFLEDTIKNLDKTLVLVLENIHPLVHKNYVGLFFDNIRSITEDRRFGDSFRVVISLISDNDEVLNLGVTSPFFNISVGIYLSPLNDDQLSTLLLSAGVDRSEHTVQKIKSLVGGNLYLIRMLLEHAAESHEDITKILAGPDIHRIFDAGIEHLRSLVSNVEGAETALEEIRRTDSTLVEIHNVNKGKKKALDELAKIGILKRENRSTEILYSVQGEYLKRLINKGF